MTALSWHERAVGMVMGLVESRYVPDVLVRAGIRHLLRGRLAECEAEGEKGQAAFIEELRRMPVAVEVEAANEQHYEVPTEYFLKVLGPRLKYSSCLYEEGVTDLATAEEAMLALYCERAGLVDGLDILELGCGWGSLCLYLAERYPASRITAVSNSRTQRAHIEAQCAKRNLKNLKVITQDVNTLELPAASVDRVMSVEMLEHCKNYSHIFGRISTWLRPGGQFFTHIFAHKSYAYHFEDKAPSDWMARTFFSGGTMPSHDLFLHFAGDLKSVQTWRMNGLHYSKTLEAWLARQDALGKEITTLMERTYGSGQGALWTQRWRLFYIACSELFRYNGGTEWGVSHYLFEKPY